MSSVRNIAPPSAPQSFDITPSGDKPILLHGWQRAYAEFDVQRNRRPFRTLRFFGAQATPLQKPPGHHPKCPPPLKSGAQGVSHGVAKKYRS